MNRPIIVALIVIVALTAGVYAYIQRKDAPQHGGNTDQSHRSYSMEITRETPSKVPGQPVSFTYTIKKAKSGFDPGKLYITILRSGHIFWSRLGAQFV